LQFNHPYVYDSNLPTSIASQVPNIDDLLNGKYIKVANSSIAPLSSLAGTKFISFAKTGKWGEDLYEDLVQEYYKIGMLIETWRNGANSDKMPSFCTPNYTYDSINILSLSFNSEIQYKFTQDHCKWAVSMDSNIFCIGDINRMFSQSKRGGGTICSQNSNIWNSLFSLIITHDNC